MSGTEIVATLCILATFAAFMLTLAYAERKAGRR